MINAMLTTTIPKTPIMSHGYTKNQHHTSDTCYEQKKGHKKEAVADNLIGGALKLCQNVLYDFSGMIGIVQIIMHILHKINPVLTPLLLIIK